MTATNGRAPTRILAYGDSKTNSWPMGGLTYRMERTLTCRYGVYETPAKIAHPGYTLAQLAAAVDADLAAVTMATPTIILVNVGVNGLTTVADGDVLTDYAYIIDALHVKYTSAIIYLVQIWRQFADAEADNFNDVLLPQLVATRGYTRLGIDERIVLAGNDDGASYSTDGVHYNAAGYARYDEAWSLLI